MEAILINVDKMLVKEAKKSFRNKKVTLKVKNLAEIAGLKYNHTKQKMVSGSK